MKKDRVKTYQTREKDLGLKSFCGSCSLYYRAVITEIYNKLFCIAQDRSV